MRRMVSAVIVAALLAPSRTASAGDGQVTFDRNDKVLTWQTLNRGDFRMSDRIRLMTNSSLSTSLNMTSSESRDRWYDTVTNSAEVGYDYSERLRFSFTADEDWNRDTMSTFGNSLLTTNMDGGVRYKVRDGMSVNAKLGQTFDRRFENKDQGARATAGMQYSGGRSGGLTYRLETNGETSSMNRSVHAMNTTGSLTWRKSDKVGVTFGFHDVYDSRGYFSDIDRKEIERRNRSERGLEVRISRGSFDTYRTRLPFLLTMNYDRNMITDTANDNKDSSKYQNDSRGKVAGFTFRIGRRFWNSASGEWGIEYSTDDNGVQRLTRRRDQTDIATRTAVSVGLGRADSLVASGWIKRTRIDTPEGVTNDRDEFKLESGVTYMHIFGDNIKTALDFRLLETHYVNIDVSQSSQNKWMKTYLLSPSLDYRPNSSVTVTHVVNVYANHIVYDFDSPTMPRSNISRRVSAETWIRYQPSSRTTVKIGGMIENNEYGKLTGEGYKIPAEDGVKRFGDIAVEYIFSDWLAMEPHYIYAIRRDWSIRNDRSVPLRREIDRTYGLDCSLFRSRNGELNIRFQRIVRETEQTGVRIRNYITLTMKYGF